MYRQKKRESMSSTSTRALQLELERLNGMLSHSNSTQVSSNSCILVRYVESLTDEDWKSMCSTGIQGWERIDVNTSLHTKALQQKLSMVFSNAGIILNAVNTLRQIEHSIELEIQRVERGSGEFSVLMLCIVSTETVAKEVWLALQEMIDSSVRGYDSVFFLKEGYFVVILPGASASNARLFARRFTAVNTEKITAILQKKDVRLHIGIATYRAGYPMAANALLENASLALAEGIEKGIDVYQSTTMLLGDIDRASMVQASEKRVLFTKDMDK